MEFDMKKLTDLDTLTRETRKVEFADGLVDITFGVIFLVLGALCWFIFSETGLRLYITALILNREITIMVVVLVISLFILLAFGSRRVVQKIRQDKLWKKSGFVASLRMQVRWPIQLAATGIAIIIIVTSFILMLKGVLTKDAVLQALVLAAGLATSVTIIGLGFDLKIKRYLPVGICGILISMAILLSGLTFSTSWLVWGISWMTILVISGIWGLRQYQAADRRLNHG